MGLIWRPPTHTPGPDFAIDPYFKLGNSQDTRLGAAGNKVADRGVPNTGDLRQILKRLQLDVVANVTANVASGKLQTGVRQVPNLSVGPLGVELFGDGCRAGMSQAYRAHDPALLSLAWMSSIFAGTVRNRWCFTHHRSEGL
ncbi:hypothetical protein ACQXZ5_02435 [Corynebacterium diphtheriae]